MCIRDRRHPDHLRERLAVLPGSARRVLPERALDAVRRRRSFERLDQLDPERRPHRVLRLLLYVHGLQPGRDG